MNSRYRFVFDEHIDPATAAGLRHSGFDVVTFREAGRAGLPDDLHIGWAGSENRIIVTFDNDCLRLDARGIAHAGIAYCNSRKYRAAGLIAALQRLAMLPAEAVTGQVNYL